jgi:predicted nucleic acid-binding protein
MAKVVCDTDVLIDYFDESKPRHLDTVRELEENISLDNVLISAVTKMELIIISGLFYLFCAFQYKP